MLRAILSITLVLAAFFALRPLDDVDLFTQLRLGASFLEGTARLPLSYQLSPDVPNPGWLAQRILAGTALLGGLISVKALLALLFACGIASALAAGVPASKGPPSTNALFLTAILLGISTAPFSPARPQSFAVLGFGLVLAMTHLPFSFSLAAMLLPLSWCWQSCHPSALIGVLPVLGALTRDRRHVISLLLFLAGAVLAGLQLDIAASNVAIAANLLSVSEWRHPWDPELAVPLLGAGLTLCAFAVLLARNTKAIPPALLTVNAVLFVGGLYSARFILFWLLHLGAILPSLLRSLPFLKPGVIPHHAPALALAALALSLALAPVLPPDVPANPIRSLAQTHPTARIYNYREFAGPIHWFGSSRWQTGLDGRLYLFTEQQWKDYEDEAMGRIPVAEIERRYQPAVFFLHPQYHRALIQLLAQSSDWIVASESPHHIAFIRAVFRSPGLQGANTDVAAAF